MTLLLTLLKSPYSWLVAALLGVGAWGYAWKLDAGIALKRLEASQAEVKGMTVQRDNALASAKSCSDATAVLQDATAAKQKQAQQALETATKGQAQDKATIAALGAKLKAQNYGKTCRDALTELRGQK